MTEFTYRYAPTPVEAAEWIETWETAKRDKVPGLPEWPVEYGSDQFGWRPSSATPGDWRSQPAHRDGGWAGHRLVVWSEPPTPDMVYLDQLPGRTILGETEPVFGCMADDQPPRWWGCDGPSKPVPITPVTHMVAVEPLPDVVPDRGVGLRKAAEALIELYSPLDFTEDRVRLLWADLRAALAAEGDEG